MRPFLPADARTLAELFRLSVEILTDDYYDDDQRAAWAASADDEVAFAKRLAGELSIVALLAGEIVGFAALKDSTLVDMLYVHPDFAKCGIGSALADALEKLAQARGTAKVSVDASDSAREFFARRGFVAQSRNTMKLGEEWLGNTTMTKELAPVERPLAAGRPQ